MKLYEMMFLVESSRAARDWEGLGNTITGLLERHGSEVRPVLAGNIPPRWRSVLSEDDVAGAGDAASSTAGVSRRRSLSSSGPASLTHIRPTLCQNRGQVCIIRSS